jgi:hypothetical protein
MCFETEKAIYIIKKCNFLCNIFHQDAAAQDKPSQIITIQTPPPPPHPHIPVCHTTACVCMCVSGDIYLSALPPIIII